MIEGTSREDKGLGREKIVYRTIDLIMHVSW